jgi:hypothetical protein
MLDGFPANAEAITLPIRAVMRRVHKNWEPRSTACAKETMLTVDCLSKTNDLEVCLGDRDEEVRRNNEVREGLQKAVDM